MTQISIIAAIAQNGAIGKNGDLPWAPGKLKADLQRFRELTWGHPVIMGRTTWESLPDRFRPLPHRTNIVLTRRSDWQAEGCLAATSLDQAIQLAEGSPGSEEIFIIGGAQTYKKALRLVDQLYLTQVEFPGGGSDRFFPEVLPSEWNREKEGFFTQDEDNAYAGIFYRYTRERKEY